MSNNQNFTDMASQARGYAQQAWTQTRRWARERREQAQQYEAAIQQATGGQVIVTYKGADAMQRGVMHMQRQGYRVSSQSSYQPRSGCLRVFMFGLLFKPKAAFVVTFVRGA